MFKRFSRVALAATLTLSIPVGASTVAGAEEPAPSYGEVQSIASNVVRDHVNPDIAYVNATYRCDDLGAPTHLWVSGKQGGPDPTAEGSGATVDAWYDSHPTTVVCDGNWQTQSFVINRHTDLGYFDNRPIWIQFCLFPNAEDFSTLIAHYQWNGFVTAPAAGINVVASTWTVGSKDKLEGHGFPANMPVTVKLGSTTLGTVNSDSNGSFSWNFVVPTNTPVGTHRLSATAEGGAMAEYYLSVQPFNVWGQPSSYYLHAGSPISFSGYRFMPGEQVEVSYEAWSTTAMANDNGDFTTGSQPFAPGASSGQVKHVTLKGLTSGATTSFNVTVAW